MGSIIIPFLVYINNCIACGENMESENMQHSPSNQFEVLPIYLDLLNQWSQICGKLDLGKASQRHHTPRTKDNQNLTQAMVTYKFLFCLRTYFVSDSMAINCFHPSSGQLGGQLAATLFGLDISLIIKLEEVQTWHISF